jgi:formylglycine-generating enzyme required for sulfatase activity
MRKASLQQFMNHLKLIMLSDRIKFIDDVQKEVDLYKKHGSAYNFTVLELRKTELEKKLTESQQQDAAWQKRIEEVGAENVAVPPSKTANMQTRLEATKTSFADKEAALEAIAEVDGWLNDLVDHVKAQNSEQPMRLVIKKGEPLSFAAALLDAYVRNPEVPMVFVPVRVHQFTMGSNKSEDCRDGDEIQHSVDLTKDVEVMATEMTNEQLQALKLPANTFERESSFKGTNLPRETVSWNEAKKVVDQLNQYDNGYVYSLLTEAQFEYAARAGSDKAFCFGDDFDALGKVAYYGKSSGGPIAVASLLPNQFGIYDLHGNVWEWVSDWYADYPTCEVQDPQGLADELSYRVLRGGSWYDFAGGCRSAVRDFGRPDFQFVLIGFRLVRTKK